MSQKRITQFIMISALLFHCAAGNTATAQDLEPLPQMHQSGKFRVIYYTEGKHAISPEDKNRNRIPDQAEDALTQTMAAYYLFVETLGFPDPFQSQYFLDAEFLDVVMCSQGATVAEGGLDGKKGLAFDQPQSFHVPSDLDDTLSISFRVASSVNAASDQTPARELFHLIQYGETFFKNSWFTEGTARWAEYGLSKEDPDESSVPDLAVWPLSNEQTTALFAMDKQAAKTFWTPLAAKMNNNGVIPFTPALYKIMPLVYTNDKPVFGSMRFPGWMFIRDVLIELGRMDNIAFRELGYGEWTEENQSSSKNNKYIMEAVNTVVTRYKAAFRL
ncbi:Peptidase MA-like domain-containing protein [Candidatus Electrothrix laxa]